MEALDRPNILFIMTDQQRFDTIGALDNPYIYMPNFDRLSAAVSVSLAHTQLVRCVSRHAIQFGPAVNLP